jgi:hypothetical protein
MSVLRSRRQTPPAQNCRISAACRDAKHSVGPMLFLFFMAVDCIMGLAF